MLIYIFAAVFHADKRFPEIFLNHVFTLFKYMAMNDHLIILLIFFIFNEFSFATEHIFEFYLNYLNMLSTFAFVQIREFYVSLG